MVLRSLTVATLLATAACSSIRPVVNAREFIQAQQPKRVWVVNNANESYVLTTPRVEGDNIVGTRMNSDDVVSIPLGSAQLVEARQRDRKKTMVVGVIVAVVAGGTLYMVANAGKEPGDLGGYTGEMSRASW